MKNILLLIAAIIIIAGIGCNQDREKSGEAGNEKLSVVTTTTMITDLLNQIGGHSISISGLMGAGVDPHLYKATESDVTRLYKADIIFYNGLHLEGKLDDILGKMSGSTRKTYAIGDAIPENYLMKADASYAQFDPHIWFDIQIWKMAAGYVAEILSAHDEKNKDVYESNLKKYLEELDALEATLKKLISELAPGQRVLITAHDAFEYFGRSFQFEVVGLQGISTVSEAGVADVRALANLIIERKIPAIFIESSVPVRNIEALLAAVKAKGFDVKTGGELYSDALGSKGTTEGTYTGMYLHNVTTIVDALSRK
jgi:manganese/zinc/iron transport system substrate-binding protein